MQSIHIMRQLHRYNYWVIVLGTTLLLSSTSVAAAPEQAGRQIEEVIVTAERQESSVQDTSISITAFTSEMIEDFGIRNQSDMQNLIPATVILPYDAAIRGVGRNFRSLGGDPGISTYMNGVYSEDLYTATIQSLWDIERIEILRGPQGTLYGRNAIGGAMNFIYKEPAQDFESEIKSIVGNYGTLDINAVVSGRLIDNVLASRFSIARRQHDGYIDEIGPGPDTDSGNERSIVGQLLWTPTENLRVKLRKNDIDVDRVMGGADGGGLIVFRGESVDGMSRDQGAYAFGFRPIDDSVTDPLNRGFYDPTSPVYTLTHPTDGTTIRAQRIRPGVDRVLNTTRGGTAGTVGMPNYAYGLTNDNQECVFTDLSDIRGDDLCAQTNGKNMEDFDQQGTQLEAQWDPSETLSLKYIYGDSDLLYQRITDDDSTYSTTLDRQFYVNHEADYTSHELQAFYDINDRLSMTSGIFFYDAEINQRGDFYSETRDPRFLNADPISQAVAGLGTMVNLYSARDLTAADATTQVATGAWEGDQGGTSIEKGPDTAATDLEYHTTTKRDAFAAYTQGVLDINEEFTLTVGARYAVDEIFGEENLMRYTEAYVPPAALAPLGITSLAVLNIYRGALDPQTLQPTGAVHLLTSGIPLSLAVHRHMTRKDKKWTGRINLDWEFADNMMVYANVTSGYRSGGYNLVFFSATPTYDPEELIAYELGYKGQHLDNTLQIFGSVYLYDYSNIHTFGAEPSATGGVTTSVLEAKGARISGAETEITWLLTDEFSVGGNLSFTPSKYTDTRLLSNVADPRVPNSLFSAIDIYYNIKGNQLLNVPEHKGYLYGIYEHSLDDGSSIKFLANYSWVDKVYHTPFADELDATPGYDRLDLRATWTNSDESITVSAFVNNVFDKIGIRQLEAHSESEGFRRTGQVTEPRVIGAEFSYKLGAY